jgi:tetratricopeptide (TPR) repeat protein
MGKISVTPLGSCRITNPLRSDFARRRIDLNMSRVYGYTHSSAEAVQLARFFQDDFHPDAAKRSLLFPGLDIERLKSSSHSPSQMYFIELSSHKGIVIDGVYVQGNYFKLHFQEFFSDLARAIEFWQLVRSGNDQLRRTFLEQQELFHACSPTDQQLLLNVTEEQATPQLLEKHMRELLERLPRVVFVSHCNAVGPDGNWLLTRSNYVRLVTDVAESLGVELYNPTALMEKFGQQKAFTDSDRSITHFSEKFEKTMFMEWDEAYIRPLKTHLGIDTHVDDESAEQLELKEKIRLAIARDQKDQVHQYIEFANRKFPHSIELAKLSLEAASHFGDFDTAKQIFDTLQTGGDAGELEHSWMQKAAFDAGQWCDVLEMNEVLVRCECQTVNMLRMSAIAAENLHRHEAAYGYWIGVFQEDLECGEIAYKIADNACRSQHLAVARQWVSKAVELAPDMEQAIMLSIQLWLEEGESTILENSISKLLGLAPEKITAIVAKAVEAGVATSVSRAIAQPVAETAVPQKLLDLVPEISGVWLQRAKEAIKLGDHINAMRNLRSVLDLSGEHHAAATLIKPYWVERRDIMRDAFRSKNFQLVVDTAKECEFIVPELREYLFLIGRSHFLLKDFGGAQLWYKRAVDCYSVDEAVLLGLARASLQIEDYVCASESFERLIDLVKAQPDPDEELIASSRNNLQRIVVKATAQARQAMAAGRFDAAWKGVQLALNINPEFEKALGTKQAIIRGLRKQMLECEGELNGEKLRLAQELLEKDPENVAGLKVRALELVARYRYQEALQNWLRLGEVIGFTDSVKSQISRCEKQLDTNTTLLVRFQLALEQDRYDDAKKIFDRVSKTGCDFAPAAAKIFQVAFEKKNFTDVIEIKQVMDKLGVTGVHFEKHAAIAAGEMENYQLAVKSWLNVLELGFEDLEIFYKIAIFADLANDHKLAIEHAAVVVEQLPDNVGALELYGQLLCKIGDTSTPSLRAVLFRLLELAPSIAKNLIEIGLKSGFAADVSGPLVSIADSDPDKLILISKAKPHVIKWTENAAESLHQGDELAAMSFLRGVLDIEPEDKEAAVTFQALWRSRAENIDKAFRAKEYQTVMEVSARCENIEKELGTGLSQIGRAAYHCNDYQSARKWLEISIKHQPDDPIAWLFLGRVGLRTEDYQLAAKAFGSALPLFPKDSDVYQAMIESSKRGLMQSGRKAAAKSRQLLIKGDLRRAWEMVQVALEIEPENLKAIDLEAKVVQALASGLRSDGNKYSDQQFDVTGSIPEIAIEGILDERIGASALVSNTTPKQVLPV